jgi:serine/threonine-protein phosphatase 2B catalytic subunit
MVTLWWCSWGVVAEILLAILKLCDDEEDIQNEQELAAAKEARKEQLRNKVRSVTKLMRMYNVVCQEREATMQLPGIGGQTGSPEALQRRASIKDMIGNFEKVKRADSEFEMKRPPSSPASPSRSASQSSQSSDK